MSGVHWRFNGRSLNIARELQYAREMECMISGSRVLLCIIRKKPSHSIEMRVRPRQKQAHQIGTSSQKQRAVIQRA